DIIAFTYKRNGLLVGCKFRSIEKRYWKAKGSENTLYGIDDINDAAEIIIVEGEIDKLSVEEAGFCNCVSVPDGAPGKSSNKLPPVEKVSRIILATDNDKPGQALARDIALRLGHTENKRGVTPYVYICIDTNICWQVRWPKKDESSYYKDANEVLRHMGPDALRKVIENAKPIYAKMQIKLKEDDGIGLASVDLSGLPLFHQSATKRKIYLCYRTETLPKCAAAMDVLSISSPIFLHTPTSKLSHSSRSKPISHFPSSSSSKFPTIKSLSVQTPKPTFTSKSQALDGSLLISSAPQTPATAMRGTEGDALGLLLRERIVFLGSSIDDFVADAIISQLLLLDAQDSKKDIKLFINSTGGSLRNIFIQIVRIKTRHLDCR
ncbi:CLP protease P4, partial [Prunus dulcis]